MAEKSSKQKVIVVGAGPVGSLAALYSAARGDDVEVYELRGGMTILISLSNSCLLQSVFPSILGASRSQIQI